MEWTPGKVKEHWAAVGIGDVIAVAHLGGDVYAVDLDGASFLWNVQTQCVARIASPPSVVAAEAMLTKLWRLTYGPPAADFAMIPVDGSSNVAAFGYAASRQLLRVQFLPAGEPGNLYEYEGVTPEVFEGFCASESKGKFVASVLRAGGYAYRRVS